MSSAAASDEAGVATPAPASVSAPGPVDLGRPLLLVLAAVSSVQVGAAVGVTLFDELGPGGTTFLRLAFGAIVLMAVWRPGLRGNSAAAWRTVVAFGITLGAMNWAFYESVARIPLGVAVTLEFVGPLGVAIAGSRRPRDFVWVGLAAGGILLLADPRGSGLDPLGAALALFAGACWATYILLSARTGAAFAGGRGLALAMVLGTVVLVPAGVSQAGSALLSPEILLAGLAVAVMSSVIPYSFELEALRTLPNAVFGVLMSLEPAVAALAGFLVLGQALAGSELAAIAMVMAASAGAALTASRGG